LAGEQSEQRPITHDRQASAAEAQIVPGFAGGLVEREARGRDVSGCQNFLPYDAPDHVLQGLRSHTIL